jgi:hypothetical protein
VIGFALPDQMSLGPCTGSTYLEAQVGPAGPPGFSM